VEVEGREGVDEVVGRVLVAVGAGDASLMERATSEPAKAPAHPPIINAQTQIKTRSIIVTDDLCEEDEDICSVYTFYSNPPPYDRTPSNSPFVRGRI
jgi:hypothetical protein